MVEYTSLKWQLPSHEDVVASAMERIILRPPITTHFVVRVSSAKVPSSWKWHHRYVNIAVMECPLNAFPKQIRTTKTQKVVHYWGKLHNGKTKRSASGRVYAKAQALAEQYNCIR